MRSWFQGHTNDWVSFGCWSNGNQYGVPEGLFYSFPVTVTNKQWTVVNGLEIDAEQRARMDKTAQELLD